MTTRERCPIHEMRMAVLPEVCFECAILDGTLPVTGYARLDRTAKPPVMRRIPIPKQDDAS